MKSEMVDVALLKDYELNTREHTPEQVAEIKNSIEEFGFNDPIGVWTNEQGELEIVEGHGRCEAAKMLGMKKVPVIYLDSLSDSERRAYGIVHNKTTQDTGFDPEAVLKDLEALDYDWEAFGFDAVAMADARTSMDDWEPVAWDDDETDEVLGAQVVTVRCRGEEQKAAMLEKLGGAQLRRMYRVGEML